VNPLSRLVAHHLLGHNLHFGSTDFAGAREHYETAIAAYNSTPDHRDLMRNSFMEGFHPQPYRQLAKVLRESGDEPGAIRVFIAGEDERYRQYGWAGALLRGFLKRTIGYGHRPLLTIIWMLGVVTLGWMMVAIGKRAGVVRPTWAETVPPSQTNSEYEHLHPLLYSFDVFLPFVNFHQEHYWWPSIERSGESRIFGRKIRISGSMLATTYGRRSLRDGYSAQSSSRVSPG
jgi:hypothetical protein